MHIQKIMLLTWIRDSPEVRIPFLSIQGALEKLSRRKTSCLFADEETEIKN